jgi:purine-binding chemotaxis protein CheW
MSEINNNRDLISTQQLLKIKINEQIIAIPIVNIRDILILSKVTKVPLAPSTIIGLINLRGRIVTAINIKNLLKMDDNIICPDSMNVVIEIKNDLYSIIADSVEEVITINDNEILPKPDSIEEHWHKIASGIILGKEGLIVIVDINKLFDLLYHD